MSGGVEVLAGEQLFATFFGVVVGLGVMRLLSGSSKPKECHGRTSKSAKEHFSRVLDTTVSKINDHHAGSEKLGTFEVQGLRLRIVRTNRHSRDMLWWPEGKEDSANGAVPKSLFDIFHSNELRAEVSEDVQEAIIHKQMSARLREPKNDILVKRCNGSTVRVNLVFGSSEDGAVSADTRFFVVMTPVQVEEKDALYRPRRKSYEAAVQMYGKHVADAVVNGDLPEPENFARATVLFLDVTNYAEMVRKQGWESGKVTEWISKVHTVAEELISQTHIRKIQSWGEMFLLVSGTETNEGDEASTQVTRMLKFAERLNRRLARELSRSESVRTAPEKANSVSSDDEEALPNNTTSSFEGDELVNESAPIRVGIHVGPITITYIATHKFAPTMSIFGDTVNTAARMEQSGKTGMVHMTVEAAEALCVENRSVWGDFRPPQQEMIIKSKGLMPTVWYDMVLRGFVDFSTPETSNQPSLPPQKLDWDDSGRKMKLRRGCKTARSSEELILDAPA